MVIYLNHMFKIRRQTVLFFLLALVLTGVFSCSSQSVGDYSQNKESGETFLLENAKKDTVKTTQSGLQYEVIKVGTGKAPKATDKVIVNYRGTSITGEEFDSGKEISFPVNQVIAGWTEGLQLMKEGASYRFFIPSDLAYGERGAGAAIQPHQTLIFEVDLVKID